MIQVYSCLFFQRFNLLSILFVQVSHHHLLGGDGDVGLITSHAPSFTWGAGGTVTSVNVSNMTCVSRMDCRLIVDEHCRYDIRLYQLS